MFSKVNYHGPIHIAECINEKCLILFRMGFRTLIFLLILFAQNLTSHFNPKLDITLKTIKMWVELKSEFKPHIQPYKYQMAGYKYHKHWLRANVEDCKRDLMWIIFFLLLPFSIAFQIWMPRLRRLFITSITMQIDRKRNTKSSYFYVKVHLHIHGMHRLKTFFNVAAQRTNIICTL